MLAALAVAAAFGPSMGGVEVQRQSYAKIPCDAPKGYFWKLDVDKGYRLYKLAPAEASVTYDAANDRSILYSGWGYVKPTYHRGDIRRSGI